MSSIAIPDPWDASLVQHTFVAGSSWSAELAKEWDVLGPFPIHAREQHFISPSFPLELTVPYEHESAKTWPSSLDETGFVNWTKVQPERDGTVQVRYPNVRWEKIRSTEGWASLQHHSVLHTTLRVSPSVDCRSDHTGLQLTFQLSQGSYFTILPRKTISSSFVPEWHAGNVYAMHRSTPISIDIRSFITSNEITEFDVFVSGDYEIRLFGDPRDQGSEMPMLSANLQVGFEETTNRVERQLSHDVVCDFVDGFALGDAFGVGLRSVEGWWKVSRLTTDTRLKEIFDVELLRQQVLAPSQSRIVPVRLRQHQHFIDKSISFNVVLTAYNSHEVIMNEDLSRELVISITLHIHHRPMWSESRWDPLIASFFFAESHPTRILGIPPKASEGISIPILALHGAGVDITNAPFWADAIPRQQQSWIIMPAGRTEWGLDWHGISAAEAWAAVPAFSRILSGNAIWKGYAFPEDVKPLVAGHSNGGQGAWYLAARFPDRTWAVLPAAGYMNPTAYVPLTQSHGARYADPALRMILESSYVTDDNALFLSNLAHKPVLVIHGDNDTNVPTWHSREYTALVSSWGSGENISLKIDPDKPHWYDEVFQSDEVANFLRRHLVSPKSADLVDASDFTLTTVDPMRSGSLFGWKIEKLRVPGRLARLHVHISCSSLVVKTSNVRVFSTTDDRLDRSSLSIDKQGMPMPIAVVDERGNKSRAFHYEGGWAESPDHSLLEDFSAGRVQNVFDTSGPIQILIPSGSRYLSIALRIAHMLDTYLKLDAEILVDGSTDDTAPSFGLGNIIVIGKGSSSSKRIIEASPRSEFSIRDGEWCLRGRPISSYAAGNSIGLLFTGTHPSNPHGLSVLMDGTDDAALERVLRLIAPRTGIAVPDWIIIDEGADSRGIGGVAGAGVWMSDWKWNEAMSWLP